MSKDAAIAQVAASLAYCPYSDDPERTQNSKDTINDAKDRIHSENKHLGLDKFQVVESNRDRFAMVSHSDKVIHIGNAGTRTSGRIGDFLNDACVFLTNHSLPGRQARVNQMVQKYAKDYPGYRVIVSGHSLGANNAQSAVNVLSGRYSNVSAIVFNSPFSPVSMISPMATAITIDRLGNGSISRFQVKTDPLGFVHSWLPGTNSISKNVAGSGIFSSHQLTNFDYLRSIGNSNGRNGSINNPKINNDIGIYGNNCGNGSNNWGNNNSYGKSSGRKEDLIAFLGGRGYDKGNNGGGGGGFGGGNNSGYQNIVDSLNNLGGYSAFGSSVMQEGLGSSYNSSTLLDLAAASGNIGNNDIGGVATNPGMIKDLENNVYLLNAQDICAIQTNLGNIPFTFQELGQIQRELAIGIFYHKTFPFFSLHFNQNSNLYPVIHPAYEGTLVGEIISYLDYFLKGYLNGGIYPISFLRKWHLNPNQDKNYLKENLIDIKKHCKDHKINIEYSSLREMLAQYGLEGQEETTESNGEKSKFGSKFRTSFRIIGKLNEVKRANNTFIVDAQFDVEYSVDLMPDYKEFLEKQQKETGKAPEDYIKLNAVYSIMAQNVKQHMPKLKFCQNLFEMFKVITFFASYYSTLKKIGQIPILTPQKRQIYIVPPCFPSIPVRYYTFHKLKIELVDLVKKVVQITGAPQFDTWAKNLFENGGADLTFPIKNALFRSIKNLILPQIGNPQEVELTYIEMLVKNFHVIIAQFISLLSVKIGDQIIAHAKEFQVAINIDTLNQTNLIDEKFKEATRLINIIREKLISSKIYKNFDEQEVSENKKVNEREALQYNECKQNAEKGKSDVEKQIAETLAQHPYAPQSAKNQLMAEKTTIFSNIDKEQRNNRENIKKHYDNIRATLRIEIEKLKKEKRQEIQKLFRENIHQVYKEMKQRITHFSNFIITNQNLKLNLAEKTYLKSCLGIADAGYYREIGDNFKIVGGCGLKMPSIETTPSSYGNQLTLQINDKLNQMKEKKMTHLAFGNQKYICFDMVHTDYQSLYNFEEVKTFFLQTEKAFEEKEIAYLDACSKNEKANEDYNPKSCDQGGKNVAHHLTIASSNISNLQKSIAKYSIAPFNKRDDYENLPIHTAAAFGKPENIEFLVKNNINSIESVNNQQHTPLISAILTGNRATLKKLIDLGANINHLLPNTFFPLLFALHIGDLQTCKILLARPTIGVSYKTSNGQTCLFTSIKLGFNQISLKILEKCTDFMIRSKSTGFTVLHQAVECQNYDITDAILAKRQISINEQIDSGRSALHIAASNGSFHIIKLLVEKYHADVNISSKSGETPLSIAIQKNNEEIALYLARLATINVKPFGDKLCSELAVDRGLFSVCDELIKRKEAFNSEKGMELILSLDSLIKLNEYKKSISTNKAKNLIFSLLKRNFGMVAAEIINNFGLSEAESHQKAKIIHFALKHDQIGFTRNWIAKNKLQKGTFMKKNLLQIAAENGSYNCLVILLKKYKIQIDFANANYLLKASIISGSEKIINLLSKYLKDFSVILERDGSTAAHLIAKQGHKHLIELMLKKNLDFTLANDKHETALTIAINNNDHEMVSALIEKIEPPKWDIDNFQNVFDQKNEQCLKIINKKGGVPINTCNNIHLVQSIKHSNLKLLKFYLSKGVNPNIPYRNQLPLFVALRENEEESFRILLSCQANPFIKEKNEDCFEFCLKQSRYSALKSLMNQYGKKLTLAQKNQYKKNSKNKCLLALLEGDETFFQKLEEQILKSIQFANIILFKKCLENFPINEKIGRINEQKKHLLIHLIKSEFEAGLSVISNYKELSDNKANWQGIGIVIFGIKNPTAVLGMIAKYFPRKQKLIYSLNSKVDLISLSSKIGKIEILDEILKLYSDPNQEVDELGNSVLHKLILCQNNEIVKKYLNVCKKGFNIDVQNKRKETPLMIACQLGNEKIVITLMQNGANPNLTDLQGYNCLLYALKCKQSQKITSIILPHINNINHKDRNGNSILILSSVKCNKSILAKMLKEYPNLNLRNKDGLQAIHAYSQYGDVFTLKMLLAYGANINAEVISESDPQKSNLNTPLHIAAQAGHFENFIFLLNNGADVTKQNSLKMTPIESAIMNGKQEIIRTVYQLPYIFDSENEATLVRASCIKDNVQVLKRLLFQGFNVNSLDKNGFSPLHWAAMKDSKECLFILLEGGATVNSKSRAQTPLFCAATSSANACLLMLLNAGANASLKNDEGNVPLHATAQNGNILGTCYLIQNGADIENANKHGITPCLLAFMAGHFQLVELLVVFGDQSLSEKRIDALPNFFKDIVFKFQLQLKKIQKIMTQKAMKPLEMALQFRNNEALKLHLKIRPTYVENFRVLLQKAEQDKFLEELLTLNNHKIIMSLNKLKEEKLDTIKIREKLRKIDLPIIQPLQQKRDKQSEIQEFLLGQNINLTDSTVESMRYILEFTTKTERKYFFQGIFTLKNKVTYLRAAENLLSRFHSSKLQISLRKMFLRFANWRMYVQYPQFDILFEDILQADPEENIVKWFLKYFQPIVLQNQERTQTLFKDAVVRFINFKKLIAINKLDLCKPPERLISYLIDEPDYIQIALLALQSSKVPEIQMMVLNKLPGINEFNKQKQLNTPIYCTYFSHGLVFKQKYELIKLLQFDDWSQMTSNYIIMKSPHNIVKFRHMLTIIQEMQMPTSQKILLCNHWLLAFKEKDEINQKQTIHFMTMADRLRRFVGISIFSTLFSANSVVKEKDLKVYTKICEYLLQLCDQSNNEEIVKKFATDELKLMMKLEEMYSSAILSKFPERNTEELKKSFLTKTQAVKNPLSVAEINQMVEIYNSSKKYNQVLTTRSLNQLTEQAIKLGAQLRIQQDNNLKANLIAVLSEVVFRHFKIYPYNTQLLAVLCLLNRNSSLKGRIGQIKTGQGKSTITAILTAYQALLGYCVDIITTSRYLSIRDQQKYSQFFLSFGITSSHICSQNPTQEMFDGQILFGTNYDFEFSILRDEIYQMNLRYTTINGKKSIRKCEIVIVDEVDSLFLDLSLNSARMAIGSNVATSWVYDPIYSIVQSNLKLNKVTKVEEIQDKLKKVIKHLESENTSLPSKTQITKWISSANEAYKKSQNIDYVIQKNSKTFEREVVIVDHKNTGRLNVGSRWSNGIHEFVEVKHKIKPKDESYTVGSISHPAFFNEYQYIYGLTGTIGSISEIKEVKTIYNVDSFDVPPHFPSGRVKIPLTVCKSKEHYNVLAKIILSQMDQGKPVLILFAAIKDTILFSDYLSQRKIHHQILNQQQAQDQDLIIEKAGSVGSVTVATNTAGRGTDIILDPEAKANGGLHTMFTFYPTNSRVEDQGLGRSGRQGQKGTAQIVISDEDAEYVQLATKQLKQMLLEDFNILEGNMIEQILYEQRQKRTNQSSILRVFMAQIELRNYNLLKTFCLAFNSLKSKFAKINHNSLLMLLQKKFINNNKPPPQAQCLTSSRMIDVGRDFFTKQKQSSKQSTQAFILNVIDNVCKQILLKWGAFFTAVTNSRVSSNLQVKIRQNVFYSEIPSLKNQDAQELLEGILNNIIIKSSL